ncbi:MAG: nucleotidyl transferase AbiEii/AbiGii toxin family protein [Candidatus Schekmanbacteria bacterium]|nr:nucleotidyl transferase AbiEii/AbiGii toxin family protein [Candidatus Schekmanbacteria bacterium]
MNEVISKMISAYECRTLDDYVKALREIMQEVALLGLWRSKFFEHSAFYGGTALRLLYGLDRYSEDLDFSLLKANPDFNISRYLNVLRNELVSYGFDVSLEKKKKGEGTAIQSAFLKADTLKQLIVVEAQKNIVAELPRGRIIKIKLEIDTNPPAGFETETKFLLQPIPFSVKVFSLPDLFAGKMHALLCRNWKSRVKGRDWYDFVWYVSNHPNLRLSHLEKRMQQSGHIREEEHLEEDEFRSMLREKIKAVDVVQIKKEVTPFLKNPDMIAIWSEKFFLSLIEKIKIV